MKKKFNYHNIEYLPNEMIEKIIDYLDYEKHCKPKHYTKWRYVIKDVSDMGEKMYDGIKPSIAWQCWGPGMTEYNFYISGYHTDDTSSSWSAEDF